MRVSSSFIDERGRSASTYGRPSALMQVTDPETVESVESINVKVPFEIGFATEGSLELKVPVKETVETLPLAAGYMADKRGKSWESVRTKRTRVRRNAPTKISDPIETPTPKKSERTHP